jgi:hypothetical protein
MRPPQSGLVQVGFEEIATDLLQAGLPEASEERDALVKQSEK